MSISVHMLFHLFPMPSDVSVQHHGQLHRTSLASCEALRRAYRGMGLRSARLIIPLLEFRGLITMAIAQLHMGCLTKWGDPARSNQPL